jgi:hypothetical protein
MGEELGWLKELDEPVPVKDPIAVPILLYKSELLDRDPQELRDLLDVRTKVARTTARLLVEQWYGVKLEE